MRIVGTGDAILGSTRLRDRIDPDALAVLDGEDAVTVNAEFTMPHRDTAPMPRGFIFGPDERVIDELVGLGANLVTFANNHTGDFGVQGVVDTLEAFSRRGLRPAGVGYSLAEARRATLTDTPGGRVALVAASATRGAESAAADAGDEVAARPGSNTLRWQQSYVLPVEQFAQLRAIDTALGTAATHADFDRVELRPGATDDAFEFGSVQAMGAVQIRRGEDFEVAWEANTRDVDALAHAVRDARGRADVVTVTVHSHEGENDGWYSDQPASFFRDAARAVVDAGADAVFGHGPHMMRGVEVYRGVPICYSLNSLTLDFDMGERISPEMYRAYGLPVDAQPWDLHGGRRTDASGRVTGFFAEERFDRGASVCSTSTPTRVRLPFISSRCASGCRIRARRAAACRTGRAARRHGRPSRNCSGSVRHSGPPSR